MLRSNVWAYPVIQNTPKLKENLQAGFYLVQLETSGITNFFFKKIIYRFIFVWVCMSVYVWCVCTYVCLESPSNHVSPSTVQGFKVSKHIAIPVFLYEFLGIWTKVPMSDWQALFLRYCVGSGITCFVYLCSVSFQSKLPIPLNLVYHLVHRYKLPCKEAGS